MKVVIETRIAANPLPVDPESIKEIDWANSSDRKWLMNHMHWAMNNNRCVELMPVTDSI